MKKILIIVLLAIISIASCKKEENNPLIGSWRSIRCYDVSVGGYYDLPLSEQRIVEYKINNLCISYDYQGNEIARCNYKLQDNTIITYGVELNGEKWDNESEYWFIQDTLKIRHDGGFEYYDEYFIRIKYER